MKIKKVLGFTVSELIIVLTLLAILGTISFVSFTGYSSDARDSVRITDLKHIETGLETYYSESGSYPKPNDGIDITYKGAMIWQQGSFGDNAFTKIRVLNSLPTDPSFGNEYSYSVLNNSSQYELIGVLEGESIAFNSIQVNAQTKTTGEAYVSGNYNGLLTKVSTGGIDYVLALPSITSNDVTSTDIVDIINNKSLIYNGYSNLPLSYKGSDFKIEGDFNYSPSNIVVYSGALDQLIEGYNQIIFLNNFQNTYSGSILKETNTLISNMSTINISLLQPSYKAKLMACSIINFKLNYDVDCDGLDYITTILEEILENETGSSEALSNILLNLPGDDINSIFIDKAGNYWFGTDEGIAYYDGTNWTNFTKDDGLIDNEVSGITQDFNLDYWIGTEKGVSKLSSDLLTWTTYTNKDIGLKKSDIQYIYTSTNGTVWIGTEKKGAASYIDGAWVTYNKGKKNEGLSSNKINTIYEDSSFNVWFGTDNKGLDKMVYVDNSPLTYEDDVINYKPNNTSNKLPDKEITYIIEDHLNNLWFGTKSGIGKLNSDQITWENPYNSSNSPNGLYSDEITYIFEDTNNNLWFGTELGVARLDSSLTNWTHYGKGDPLTNRLKSDEIISIYEDTNGNILILGEDGMDTIDTSLVVNPSNP